MTSVLLWFGRSLIAPAAGLSLVLAGPALAAPVKNDRASRDGGHQCWHMEKPGSRISVAGAGVVRVAPDLAVIRVGVSTQADTAAGASQQNAQSQTAVIEAIRDAGIEAKDIQTSGFNLGPVIKYGEDVPPEVVGYTASNTVSVRVIDLARLGEVLDGVVAAGSNQIDDISFARQDSAATEDEARRQAVRDARRKARVMAGAAGLELGRVISIRDSVPSRGVAPMMMRAEMAKDSSVPIEAGELSVSAEVQIDFALVDKDAAKHCGPNRKGKANRSGGEHDNRPQAPAGRN